MMKLCYVRCSLALLVFVFHLTAARHSYKEAKFVAAKGRLTCNGRAARNAVASIVAYTSESAHTLNDAPADSHGSYSLEAAFLPTGSPFREFKLRIQYECVDTRPVQENRTKHRLRPHKRLPNETNKEGISTHVFRELPVPNEYVYDWTMPTKVYDFSIDLAH